MPSSGGNSFPTYPPPPPFAPEKTVFSPLLGQNSRKFVNFPWRWVGGGGKSPPRPTKISATDAIKLVTRYYQLVPNLLQHLGTSSANTTCRQLENRFVTTCLQTFWLRIRTDPEKISGVCLFGRAYLKALFWYYQVLRQTPDNFKFAISRLPAHAIYTETGWWRHWSRDRYSFEESTSSEMTSSLWHHATFRTSEWLFFGVHYNRAFLGNGI